MITHAHDTLDSQGAECPRWGNDPTSSHAKAAATLGEPLMSSSMSFALVDTRQHIVDANAAFTTRFKAARKSVSVTLVKAIAPALAADAKALERALASPEGVSLGLTLADKRAITLHIAALAGTTRLVMVEHPAAHAARIPARQAPLCDPLTGLDNRQMLDQAVKQWVACHPGDTRLALIIVDLDRFKQVNDTLGHDIGDALLKLVAKRLTAATRAYDNVIRLGGDEFVVLHTAAPQPEGATAVAKRIVDIISRPFLVNGHQINIGASLGISLFNPDADDAPALLKRADLALYDAKAAGRGTYRFFAPLMETQALERRAMEISLRRALTLKEFVLYYQPQVDLGSGAVTGFEALIRWNNRERGLISPADFIPLAEEIGEIHAIGDWVIRTACLEAAAWPGELAVAVNVSPLQFSKGDIVKLVSAALKASGLKPSRLEIEITESALISDAAAVVDSLRALRELGVGIAMDDFGTGYSSLSYLNSFPFSKLKIDQSFIRGNQSTKSQALVQAVLYLGKVLGMTTIAEGIETQQQYDALAKDGCASAQGYLISRPMPASAITAYLSTYNVKQKR